MSKSPLQAWDAVDNLKTDKDRSAYIRAAVEENDDELLAVCIRDVCRSFPAPWTDAEIIKLACACGIGYEIDNRLYIPAYDNEQDFISDIIKFARALLKGR